MPDVISDTNGKLCVGSYHMWRLLSSPDNYSLCFQEILLFPLIKIILGTILFRNLSRVCLTVD